VIEGKKVSENREVKDNERERERGERKRSL